MPEPIRKNYRWILIVVVFILLLLSIISKHRKFSRYDEDGTLNNSEAFNRNTDHLILTRHAKCRMQCRDIILQEIKEILHDGNINYAKSDLNDRGGPTYALEGYSDEHQHLRIVFAPEEDGMVVVTTIDLDKEWPCDCK